MICPFLDSLHSCSCRRNREAHLLSPMEIESYCRRSRYVLCPVFNEAESVDLTDIFEDETSH